jgi:hypothetical protein
MAEDNAKLRKLEDPIARKKRKMEEALARKKAKSEDSEDTLTSGSSDATTSADASTGSPAAEPAEPAPAEPAEPAAAKPAEPAAAKPAEPTEPTPAKPAATTPAAGMLEVKCPACANEARLPASFKGQLVKCAGCKAALRLEPGGAVLAPQAATPPPPGGADEAQGLPLPLVAGAGALVLILLLAIAFRSPAEPPPSPSPTQVAASPTVTTAPSPTATEAPSPTATAAGTPSPTETPAETPEPSPTAELVPPLTPSPAATPEPTPIVSKLLGQIAAVTSAGERRPVGKHRLRIVGDPQALLSTLPAHELAYRQAVDSGLAQLRSLDVALSSADYDAQSAQLLRRMRRDTNEVVRTFRALVRKQTVLEVLTDNAGFFTAELDPGDYLLVSDEWFDAADGRHTVFATLSLSAGEQRFNVPQSAIDRVSVLVERPVPGDE